MSLETLSSFSSALSEEFGMRVYKQMNRKQVLLSRLTKMPGKGPNCAWDVTFSGASAGTFSEGADVSAADLAQDEDVPATLSWGLYRSSFGLSGLAKAVARSSTSSPSDLLDRVMKDLDGSASKLGSDINVDLYTGSGSASIIGLQSALAATGTYANISKASKTEWAGNVVTNSGTPRPLTKALMDELESMIYDDCGEQPPLWVTTSAVARKYENLFDQVQRTIIVNDISSVGAAGGGEKFDVATGETGLNYKGHALLRDKDCPAEHIFALNPDYAQVEFVPAVLDNDTGAMTSMASLVDERGVAVGLMAHFQRLAKLGDSDRYSLVVYPQLKITKVNAHGFIDDIDES